MNRKYTVLLAEQRQVHFHFWGENPMVTSAVSMHAMRMMSPIQDKLTDPSNMDDPNERVLEAAALETSPETEKTILTNWDGKTVAGKHGLEVKPAQSGETIGEQQVEAGNDETDLEQRLATVINHREME